MTDPAVRDRLTALQARLTQSTPAPLEGQQTIPVDDEPQDHGQDPVTQPTLW
ncbi:MAG: hypothetical protein HOV92_12770 [Streptomyces sp.]|nr:hypothetical protein [Streptomyces sp.]